MKFLPLRFSLSFFLCCFAGYLVAQNPIHTCTVIPTQSGPVAQSKPAPDLPPGVQKAVSYRPTRYQSRNWTPGGTVTVRFMGGSAALRQRVMHFANEWTQYANLNFVVTNGRADIRVGFTQNGSSWSVIGSSSNQLPQDRPTMNFGWFTDQTPDYEVKRTVLHEFGHALGLLHEHQNPSGGIPWDEEAVYNHYASTQGWDRNTTYTNVMARAGHDKTQYSNYDQASIMHYPVPAQLTGGRYAVGMNNELSTTDKHYIALLYPGRSATRPAPAPAPERPTTTTNSRPAIVTKPAPARQTHRISILNKLSDSQKDEVVRIDIAERTYTVRLDRNGRSSQTLNLDLPRGRYPYRVAISSTVQGYQTVRTTNGQLVRRVVERRLDGGGSGTLSVEGNDQLVLYGSYDQDSGRLKVYLGKAR